MPSFRAWMPRRLRPRQLLLLDRVPIRGENTT